MSHLLFIFGLRLGGRGFLLREAHPQARDEFPGQGAPGEGWGQDGKAAGQQQALQRVLAAGTRGSSTSNAVLPAPAMVSTCSKCVLDTAQGWWGEAAGILPPRRLLAKHSLQFLPASPTIRNR